MGIMVHSTGTNNPFLYRYVGPDDGKLGVNLSGNHWNQYKPGGKQVCVHAFIGRLSDGTIATYQTLPWNYRAWHCGSGKKGSGNDTHISFEICEDNLTNEAYFRKVFKEAVELCVYLCKVYGLTEENIICHSEGYKLGIASNHADVMHWFPKFGESMDSFRTAVKAAMKIEEKKNAAGESGGKSYRVQVGTFSSKSSAEMMVKKLKSAGFYGHIRYD
jgi:N-acetylmuramoyl-L-alanine amidase CwlA